MENNQFAPQEDCLPPEELELEYPSRNLYPTETEQNPDTKEELLLPGIPVHVIPEQIYPGMQYTTPGEIDVSSGVTPYSRQTISRLVQSGEVEGYKIGSGVIVTYPRGVQQLKDRASDSKLRHVGTSKPGPRHV